MHRRTGASASGSRPTPTDLSTFLGGGYWRLIGWWSRERPGHVLGNFALVPLQQATRLRFGPFGRTTLAFAGYPLFEVPGVARRDHREPPTPIGIHLDHHVLD